MFDEFWHGRLRRPFRLSFQRFGHGSKALVLLHGIASDCTFWQPLVKVLSEDEFTIFVPDLLGHGDSPKPDYIEYTTTDQAKAVVQMLRKQGIHECILVGHSMGSLVATRVATTLPQRVARLLLYEPPLFAAIPEFKTRSRRQKFYVDMYERIAKNPAGLLTVTRVVATISRNWTKFLVSEQAWLPIERSLRNTIINQTSIEELKDIAIQTDIVHGRLDAVVPRSGLRKSLKHNQNIKFYKTTDNHGISPRSARYLAGLIAPEATLRQNRKQ
ncbi:alpha/beta hydrolase [Aeromicrobium sp.]|nr:alpha/beta hydrolase [Candidatus Saccharibacteria bacterium]